MPLFPALFALAAAAVFPPGVSQADLPGLLKSTAFVRALDENSLIQMVPQRSGLRYVGCPNCNSGRQEGQLSWSPDHPAEVFCTFCNHRYPSPRYPMSGALTVRNPRGETQSYPYWEDPRGYRYFFEARRDDLAREYLAARARELAQLYALTRDRSFARRAALILDRFAEVFPGWCYHYDYPFQQKIVYEGRVPPEQFRPGYRTSRWTWWAYSDIPTPLVQAFDWIRPSGALEELSRAKGIDVAARIENDLFRNAAAQVIANPETYGNMSPSTWTALVTLGRVIGEPAYVDDCVQRLRRFLQSRFFYDGVWPEGAPSYHAQTVGNLSRVLEALKGYGGKLDIESLLPSLQRSQAALMKMRLPDGRFAPVHDTWSTSRSAPPPPSESYLLPALGHACLAGGRPAAPSQYHLTWSGGYGHQHADNLSLLIFGHGRELASDLGYTHTRQRAWTLSTAAHNTVVIDGRNQHSGSASVPSDGSLRWFDAGANRIQTVSAAGERGYPDVANLYRRTLIMVGGRYAVDIFEVDGGRVHDYFLHGDTDFGGTAQTPLPLEPLLTLLPEGFSWRAAQHEGEARLAAETWWGYGYLRNLRAAAAPSGVPLCVTLRSAGGGGLGVILLPEEGSRLVLGEGPAVRGAKEDDARLDDFSRPFMMLRHDAAKGRSTFVAVLEPFASAPEITSVQRVKAPEGTVSLRIVAGGRTELVTYTPDAPNGRATERLPLIAVEADALLVAGSPKALPRPGEVVRLITGDGWVYPYHVAGAEIAASGVRIRLAEGPGLVFDGASARVRLTAYPQREHTGPAAVEWLRAASPQQP
ncbi:MAG TPA: heparinase II/III family protein [Bryobacteraceae bacterium]|nr:heparinase II/III family protein [Bryobacteraceae bacterium]